MAQNRDGFVSRAAAAETIRSARYFAAQALNDKCLLVDSVSEEAREIAAAETEPLGVQKNNQFRVFVAPRCSSSTQ